MRLLDALLSIAPALLPALLAAQSTDSGLASCAAIKGDLLRLACYDSVASARGAAPTTTVASQSAGAGRWLSSTTTNPLDDTRTVTLMLPSENAKSRLGRSVVLILRCKSKHLEAYINWQDFLGSDDASVTIRLGQDKPQTKNWSISTDHVASFYPGDHWAFLSSLQQVDKLVAQVTPYSESPVTAIVDLTGLATLASQLTEACPAPRH